MPRSPASPRGQGVGVLRDVIIADTDAEAMALWEIPAGSPPAWFEPFGFRRGMQDPGPAAIPPRKK